jgi:hypothetical protein
VKVGLASFMSCFIGQTLISKTVSWVKLFFSYSQKDMSWDEAEKVAYFSSLPHFSLSSMHEAVGEAVLPNNFSLLVKQSCAKRGLNRWHGSQGIQILYYVGNIMSRSCHAASHIFLLVENNVGL